MEAWVQVLLALLSTLNPTQEQTAMGEMKDEANDDFKGLIIVCVGKESTEKLKQFVLDNCEVSYYPNDGNNKPQTIKIGCDNFECKNCYPNGVN